MGIIKIRATKYKAILRGVYMPIYEYKCKNCKYQFEQLQKITEKPPRVCPKCKKAGIVKMVSSTNFQLKGTGWYVTDFKDKKKDSGRGRGEESQADSKAKKKETKLPEKSKVTSKK